MALRGLGILQLYHQIGNQFSFLMVVLRLFELPQRGNYVMCWYKVIACSLLTFFFFSKTPLSPDRRLYENMVSLCQITT